MSKLKLKDILLKRNLLSESDLKGELNEKEHQELKELDKEYNKIKELFKKIYITKHN